MRCRPIQAGYLRTISVPDGAGSNLDFVGEIWPLLKDAPNVILAGDGDEPGRKLNAELARRFGAARCAWVEYPDGAKDLNDILRLQGETAVGEALYGRQALSDQGPLQAQRLSRRRDSDRLRDGLPLPQSLSAALARRSSSSSPVCPVTASRASLLSCWRRWRCGTNTAP